jgi:hypothetical protein
VVFYFLFVVFSVAHMFEHFVLVVCGFNIL